MNNKIHQRVVFYHVKNNQDKIQFICNKAQEAFQNEKRLLIIVNNHEAAQYIDTLLWRLPENSFHPHVISNTETQEWIAITTQTQHNINRAICLINLCTSPVEIYKEVQEIFEFFDETHPQKIDSSKKKLLHYQSNGLVVKTETYKVG